jgi:PhnB protein
MRAIYAYLTFDGDCREAMTMYAKALGAEAHLMTFGETGQGGEGVKDRIMHAKIAKGSAVLMASDSMPGVGIIRGTNCSISIDCENSEEMDPMFAALGEGGKVTMELQDTFWGARFGMLTDRFGVQWMLNWDKPKQ